MDGKTLVEASGQSPERMESYEWNFPGSPVRVRLKLDIVPGILDHLKQGWQEERLREAGGILLGEISGNCVEISGFDPFFCAQQPGSRFVVRGPDLVRFTEHISYSSQAVGYFRGSDTLSLHDDDLALIDAAFQNPFHVFLVVKRGEADGWPVADFFFRDGERVFTESILPFLFDQRLLETEARSALLRPVDAVEERTPQLDLQSDSSKHRRHRMLVIASLILIGVVLFSILLPRRMAVPVSGEQPLSLVVRPQKAEVIIEWDPALPAIRNARIGMLSLHDDAREEEIPLPVTALRTGQFVYKTTGKPVLITLEVFSSDGQRSREMAIVPGAESSSQHDVSKTPTPTPFALPPTLSTETQTESHKAPPSRKVPSQFQMPNRQGNDPVPASIFAMEPPSLAGVQAHASPPIAAMITPASTTPPIAAAAPPAADSAQVPVTRQPMVAPPSQTPQARLSVAATVSPVPATPPKPILQTRPELPANVRTLLQNEVVVQVHLMIDAAGRVTKATPVPAKSAIAEYAGKAAATAARRWRFEPSRREGQPVASEVVLEFRFAPAAKIR